MRCEPRDRDRLGATGWSSIAGSSSHNNIFCIIFVFLFLDDFFANNFKIIYIFLTEFTPSKQSVPQNKRTAWNEERYGGQTEQKKLCNVVMVLRHFDVMMMLERFHSCDADQEKLDCSKGWGRGSGVWAEHASAAPIDTDLYTHTRHNASPEEFKKEKKDKRMLKVKDI